MVKPRWSCRSANELAAEACFPVRRSAQHRQRSPPGPKFFRPAIRYQTGYASLKGLSLPGPLLTPPMETATCRIRGAAIPATPVSRFRISTGPAINVFLLRAGYDFPHVPGLRHVRPGGLGTDPEAAGQYRQNDRRCKSTVGVTSDAVQGAVAASPLRARSPVWRECRGPHRLPRDL